MSQENVEIVRKAYQADQLTDAPQMASNAEFDFTAVYPDRPVLQGVEEVRGFRDRGPWGQSTAFEPERYFDVDDARVLVFVRATSTGRASGTPIETRIAQEFTIHHGLIVRVKVHRDRANALASVGLAE